MQFNRATREIRASRHDWNLLHQIAGLKGEANFPEAGLWRKCDDQFLWRCIVAQICNRGGVAWTRSLDKRGDRKAYEDSLSLMKLRSLRRGALKKHVRQQMDVFHVGRFREDNTESIIANLDIFVDSNGRLTELSNRLNDLDITAEKIGRNVQEKERILRKWMMERLCFFQGGKKHHAKRKPPSDFLINIGFARTLIPFDSRQKRVFKELFGISIYEDISYEPVEDFFLFHVYPKLNITPSEFDRIVFQHNKKILEFPVASSAAVGRP
jgi:hypothetical protein